MTEYALKKGGSFESVVFKAPVTIQTQGRSNITILGKIDDSQYTKIDAITGSNKITDLNEPFYVDVKLSSKQPFNYTLPFFVPKYYNKTKIEDFLYEITYGNIDYQYAYSYFKASDLGGCSAIRNGNFFGRNFDWLYNNQVQFVVHTPSSLSHYGVLGVSGIIPDIDKSNVDNDEIIVDGVDMFKLVPFYLLDGVNEMGVFCTHNIVPLDNISSPTKFIYAQKEERDVVSVPMLVRFILDKFANAEEAINYLINYTTIYFPDEMLDSGYQSHFMIGDMNSTYVLEFIDGEISIMNHKFITNFNITDVTFDKNGNILYPPTQFGVDQYGMGLERWDIISSNYKMSNTMEGMRSLLKQVYFSNAYSDDFWYSEIVKEDDDDGNKITVDTLPEKCTLAKEIKQEQFQDKDRDNPKVWITCHSSIYNIQKRTLNITNQENQTEYVFAI